MADDPTRGRNRPNPHTIPSQNPVRRQRLYVPEGRGRGADLSGTEELKRRHPNLPMPGEGVHIEENLYSENPVLSTFDSRPVNASDFLITTPLIDVLSGPQNVSFPFRVPTGRVLIMRLWEVSSIFQTVASPITNPNGTSNVRARIRFLVDGSDVPNYSNLLFNTLPFGVASAPSFLVAPSDSLFEFAIDLVNTNPDISFADGQIVLYGNLLRATGRNINFEQATENPLPVVLKG